MKGSIRFNNDINIEVDVDPAAEEGARLSSAVNLVDGQELGVGGSDLPEVTVADEGKVLAVNASGEWAAEQYAGYDVVVQYVLDTYTPTLLKGNYSTVRSKIENNIPVLGLMVGVGDISLDLKGASAKLAAISLSESYMEIFSMLNDSDSYVAKWNADGTIEDITG